MSDTPPTDPVADPVVTDPVDPVTETPVPTDDPPTDPPNDDNPNPLEEKVNALETAISELSDRVASLAPVPVVDPDPSEQEPDESPVSVPWTHRGFGGKRDD